MVSTAVPDAAPEPPGAVVPDAETPADEPDDEADDVEETVDADAKLTATTDDTAAADAAARTTAPAAAATTRRGCLMTMTPVNVPVVRSTAVFTLPERRASTVPTFG